MLCSQGDVEQRLQIDFTNNADPVCASLIAAAQGHIEREVGRAIEATVRAETLDGPPGSYLWLKWTPVNSVTSVVVDGTALVAVTDYIFDGAFGKLARVSSGYLTGWAVYKPASVVVTYNGGYTTVPLDLRDLCATVAARAFQAGAAYAALPAGSDGISQEGIGSYSVQYFDEAAGGLATKSVTRPVQLTPEEIAICHHYRPPAVA